MLGLPKQVGRPDRQRQNGAQIRPGRKQPWTRVAIQQQPAQRARAQEQRGKFGQQAQAGGEPHAQPGLAVAQRLHSRQKIHKAGAGDDGRHVRRGRQQFDGNHQGEVEEQCGQCGAILIFQDQRSRPPDKPGCGHRQNDTAESHAPGRVAEQGGAGTDQPGDHGGMIEITRRQMLRPQPVISLVRRQRQLGRRDGAQRQQNENAPCGDARANH